MHAYSDGKSEFIDVIERRAAGWRLRVGNSHSSTQVV